MLCYDDKARGRIARHGGLLDRLLTMTGEDTLVKLAAMGALHELTMDESGVFFFFVCVSVIGVVCVLRERWVCFGFAFACVCVYVPHIIQTHIIHTHNTPTQAQYNSCYMKQVHWIHYCVSFMLTSQRKH